MRVSLTAALQISSSIGLNLAGPYDRVNATTSPVRDRIDDSAVGGVPRDLVVVLVCNLHPAWRYRCFTSSGPLFFYGSIAKKPLPCGVFLQKKSDGIGIP
jgi:hypothetical protein